MSCPLNDRECYSGHLREFGSSWGGGTSCADAARDGSPSRAGDPPALVADLAEARHRLDWRPRYADLATQVTHAWAWRQGGVKNWKRMQRSAAEIASR
jgi:hypothetical protein